MTVCRHGNEWPTMHIFLLFGWKLPVEAILVEYCHTLQIMWESDSANIHFQVINHSWDHVDASFWIQTLAEMVSERPTGFLKRVYEPCPDTPDPQVSAWWHCRLWFFRMQFLQKRQWKMVGCGCFYNHCMPQIVLILCQCFILKDLVRPDAMSAQAKNSKGPIEGLICAHASSLRLQCKLHIASIKAIG